MRTPRPRTSGIAVLFTICCTLVLPLTAAAAWLGDYFPLIMNSSWTYQNVDPPYDTYSESVFEQLDYDGNPAVRVGYDWNEHTIAFNDGHTVTVYAEVDGGVVYAYDEYLVLGDISDGTSAEICSSGICETLLIRDWNAIDPSFHEAYGVDPGLGDFILIASYTTDFDANIHNAMLASNLPDGVTLPDGAVNNIEWYLRDVGLSATISVDAESGGVEEYYALIDYAVAVEDGPATPDVLIQARNFPNPFNPVTTIRFELAAAATVAVTIHDAAGRLIRTLDDGTWRDSGVHTLSWRGLDNLGRAPGSGTYFCRLQAAGVEKTLRMTLIR